MISKVVQHAADAVKDIADGSVVGISGFGVIHGFPTELIAALATKGATELVIVCNSLGNEQWHPVTFIERGQARKLIASFSARAGGLAGSAEALSPVPLEVELVPQGILVERLRSAGAGLGPFYSPVGTETDLALDKERRQFAGEQYVLELPLQLDFALIYAHTADKAGNLAFRGTSQNFGPSFAKGAKVVIAEVEHVVEVGELAPEDVDLPGIFVDRVLQSSQPRQAAWRAAREADDRREYLGRPGRTPSEIGAKIASLLPEPSYVNLGVGLPTLVSDHLQGRDVTLHAENGVLGYGPRLDPAQADLDLYNAGTEPVSLAKGASVFDSVAAFEMARSGRLNAVVLGAFQVSKTGSLANWTTPQMGGGAIGGAMDLLVKPGRLIIAMRHCERSGQAKIVEECDYPLTGVDCVDLIVTDLAVIERVRGVLVLREVAPGFTSEEVCSLTGTELRVELWEKELANDHREVQTAR